MGMMKIMDVESELHPELSQTVRGVVSALPTEEPIPASLFAQEIIKRHAEYAAQKASSLLPLEETRERRPAKEWLEEVQHLFDSQRLWKLSGMKEPPILNGRLVLVGLGLLEPRLRSQLEKDDIFAALIREIHEPIEEILTPTGLERYRASPMEPPPSSEPSDSVPNQPDEPLRHVNEDQLGRAAFARFLVKRIEAVPIDSGAYSLHVYGPWGSGKTTVLNFVRCELEAGKEWIIAEFNAWRHQHIRPPWWSLMESFFQQTKRELSWQERLCEYWWRFNTGRNDYILGLLVLAWIVALFVFPMFHPSAESTLKGWGTAADSLGKIVAVIVSIWGIVIAFSRSLLFGSAKAAMTYMELTHDPMNTLKERFTKLIERIRPKRAVVFIDDLDRCQGSYVIELLEGIQTLFKEAPVVFVIAADRKWLNACYEQNYEQFKTLVCEPGKPLGTLFLEKAFQFCTPVPGIPKELKEAFWQKLLQVQEGESQSEKGEARQKALDLMETAKTEGTVLRFLDESRDKPFHEQRAIREAAVVRLAAPEVVERTEHALMKFAGLLDPNPRSMKRLVNAYSVNRALATLSHNDIERDRLALWTVLALRWPLLAEFLEDDPKRIEEITKQNTCGFPEELEKLCSDGDVLNVVSGGPTSLPLNADHVAQCALLRM
jgi:hypothetical protein